MLPALTPITVAEGRRLRARPANYSRTVGSETFRPGCRGRFADPPACILDLVLRAEYCPNAYQLYLRSHSCRVASSAPPCRFWNSRLNPTTPSSPKRENFPG